MNDIDDILEVIDLYKDDYPVWNGAKVKDIFYHIYPSIVSTVINSLVDSGYS